MPLAKRSVPAAIVVGLLLLMLLSVLLPCSAFASGDPDAGHGTEKLGARLPLWACIPFAGILLSIAFFPLFAPRWWHHHFPKVSFFWGAIFAVPFLLAFRGEAIHNILHVYFLEYVPFIILLWALFTISGGIHVGGTLRGSPGLNLGLLVLGTAIASWVGTTGASMILIRPLLRANKWRRHNVHVMIFFIFLVSNIGGALTPLGDPPLFLGFLLGVPFFWTMRLLPEMLVVALPILIIFYILDHYYFRKEKPQPVVDHVPLRIDGAHNILFLIGVVSAVLFSGMWHPGSIDILGIHVALESIVRDSALVLLGLTSLRLTKDKIHKANEFSWFPIKEVAILFAGIFMTIIPAITILQAGEEGAFAFIITALKEPSHYFWVTGALSSFLDNAPSYLTLFNSLLGKFFSGIPMAESVPMLITEKELYLKSISLGAVFFGALTYIGNAPNFMVKSIAEEAGIRMPSFFGYMFKYSLIVLIPLFVALTWIFFSN